VQRLALLAILGIAVARPGISQAAQASHDTRFITSDLNATDEWPCLSPDGQTVLFSRTTDGGKHWDLFVVPTAGGAARPLTNVPLPVSATRPDWPGATTKLPLPVHPETGSAMCGSSIQMALMPEHSH
jgi:hypothetical protein